MKQNFINFFPKQPDEAYRFYLDSMFEEITNVEVFDGVFEFLEFCIDNNIKTSIITNRDCEYIEQFKTKNPNGEKLLSLIDFVVTADESGFTKPDPKILKYSIEKAKIDLANYDGVFFIGDALADANLVRNQEIKGKFILMAKTTSDISRAYFEELRSNPNNYIFSDYKLLLESLSKIK